MLYKPCGNQLGGFLAILNPFVQKLSVLKGLVTNFVYITLFCVSTKGTFFIKGPS